MKKIKVQKSLIANLFCAAVLTLIASCSKVVEPAPQALPAVTVSPVSYGSAAKSANSVQLSINSISASATYSSSYPASNATDENLSTRWTASGTVYLYADLGTSDLIDYVKLRITTVPTEHILCRCM
jgi:hypothetical protein